MRDSALDRDLHLGEIDYPSRSYLPAEGHATNSYGRADISTGFGYLPRNP